MELRVRAASARNLIDTQVFSTQDPYCRIVLHKKSYKTRVHDNGVGSRASMEPRVLVPSHRPADGPIARQGQEHWLHEQHPHWRVCLPVNVFLHGGFTGQWYALHNDGKNAGEINLQVHVIGGPAPVVQGQMYAAGLPPQYEQSQHYGQQPVPQYGQVWPGQPQQYGHQPAPYYGQYSPQYAPNGAFQAPGTVAYAQPAIAWRSAPP